ncbi:probable LRR receptor-like serine/threonine-protein kinase At3g47570 [Sesamum indicum]|uniref:non-specific serine/threonine protein kinase n=1 Tax=Sesamum indicum TaxID=4182 RepID=A0A6I9U290_SESIN|nr:probable LRR receptor-like serine/threonine-protein kinase At3g47570 [Sesamum indicum]
MNSIFLPSASLALIFLSCCMPLYKSSSIPTITGNMTDRMALVTFKAGLITDPLHVTESWNDSTHFCSWIGITCSLRHQRVVKLDLHSSMLVGTLAPSIGNLSFLRELQLYNNGLTGEIPSEIGKLSRLTILSLENNSFSGEIPRNISRCSKLIKLGVGGNHLVGSIPMEFQSLSNLQLFFLYLNNLTGELPPYLGNITSLVSISVGGNQFVGNIPDTLGHLKNLENIELGLNRLSGTFPPSFFNLSSLKYIDIPENQIHGSLPSDIFVALPRLQKLNVARNQLTGNIPSSVSNATELLLFAININGFSGEVPSFKGLQKLKWLALNRNQIGRGLNFMSSLLNCTQLRLLHLSENNFEGLLPKFIGNFSNLRRFTAGKNLLHGNIPSEIGDITNLETLYLWSNQLTGSIPNSIGKLQKLKILSLPQNILSGKIPSSFGNLTMLTEMYLQANYLQGTIPSALGKCQSLLAVDISHNKLGGSLPIELFTLSSLSEFLDISSNSLVGSLPSDASSLEHLVLLNLSNNKLSGAIPDNFGSLISLRELYLANNSFYGNISPSLSSLKSLEVLNLSHNDFTGEIPEFLEKLPFLRNLNLSFNDFEGEVPTEGVFRNRSQVSVNGNPRLCGGFPDLELPVCPKRKISKKSRTFHSLYLIISICSLTLVIILVLLFVVACYQKHKKNLKPSESSGIFFLPTISFQSLYNATDGFSEANLIGSGKFSSVYRGILNQNETVVAVKVLKLQVEGSSKSFLAECEALRKIRHRNLVKILTSCSSLDFQGNEFKALVYALMENGSLEDWLHQDEKIGGLEQGQRQHLTLIQRLNIAIDVASALDYLHHNCGTPLVHRDIKPSNILLDGEFVAHVSDFGLAKFMQEATQSLSSSQYNSSGGIKGTIGYAAPEYGMGRESSTYGDVYSYGILLLELFTGKSPTDDAFINGLTIHSFAKMAIPKRVMEIVDPKLVYDKTTDFSLHQIEECLISVLQIGISCSTEFPGERMDISRIISQLYSTRNALLRTRLVSQRVGSLDFRSEF